MDQYRAGSTLFIECTEGCQDHSVWWMDASVHKVVRYNSDTGYVAIYVREKTPPTIRSWVSPLTFHTEHRLLNKWHVTTKYNGIEEVCVLDLPINMIKYTMQDRIRNVA